VKEDGLEAVVLETLLEIGWQTQHGPEIAPGEAAAARSDYREVVLSGVLRTAVTDLNPQLPVDAVDQVVKDVLRPESPVTATENWRVYRLLLEGVPVDYRTADGERKHDRARLIDFTNPAKNLFLAVNQFTIKGKTDRRPDVICFVNGLPLAVLELKRPGEPNATVKGAFNQVQTYRNHIPDLFTYNQLCVISDGVTALAGTYSAGWEHYAPWKTIDGAGLAPSAWPQIEVLLKGMLNPRVFLDLVRSYTAVYGEGEHLVKKVAKYHQYWAVTKAVDSTLQAVAGDGRAGVVWHTQGSGKSLEMLFYTGKIARHAAMENPTVVVLTDRNDLDDQLFDETFAASRPGAPLPEPPVQAESRDHLRDLLSARQSGGIIFTTIQKFGLSQADKEVGRSFPELSDRANVVVMVDEAHRSNYDFIDGFARHLRDGLPNASFIGFTGTPIEVGDKSTRGVFGELIDVYDLTQAVADGATVKVFYEPRLARVELPESVRAELDEKLTDATSGTEDEITEKVKSRWAKVEAIVGSDKRIAELAEDIVTHWEARREVLAGKAMVVAMSRRIAVALYDAIVKLRPDWHSDDGREGVLKVVMTGSAADDQDLQVHVRNKQQLRELKSRAKDPADPLEIVIVRDMWLTGFDSPSMHTMYVDKPMRGASLMQAIARVNRTFKDKPAGLVVDYLGIAEDLKSALTSYTRRDQDNGELGQDLRDQAIPALVETHEVVVSILSQHGWRELVANQTDKAYLRAIASTVDHLLGFHPGPTSKPCTKDEPCRKCRFMASSRKLASLFAICAPSDETRVIRDDVAFFEAVRGTISKLEMGDGGGRSAGAELDTAIRQLVSESMTGTGVLDLYAEAGLENPDISLIDESFVEKFHDADNKNLQLELLKRLLAGEIRLVTRRNIVAGRQFSDMLTASLLRYQNRSLDAAQVVAELVALAQQLKAETARGAATGLKPDELAFYDAICTNDAARALMADETLKLIARELVEIVRRDAKTDWTIKEQVRAKLRATIRRLLLKHGYPPDMAPAATDLVLAQAEVFGLEGAA
jgi:type I restriction enzyme R subunit